MAPTREEAGEKGRLMLLPRRHWLPSAANNGVLFSPGSCSDQQNGPALRSDNAQFCFTRARANPLSYLYATPPGQSCSGLLLFLLFISAFLSFFESVLPKAMSAHCSQPLPLSEPPLVLQSQHQSQDSKH